MLVYVLSIVLFILFFFVSVEKSELTCLTCKSLIAAIEETLTDDSTEHDVRTLKGAFINYI